MLIRQASINDIDSVLQIYDNAKATMKDMGINQWQDGYPNIDSLKSDINQGISIVCEENGELLATAAAYIGHDLSYDIIHEGQWLTDSKEYGIIHRIAVSKKAKNKGVATAIFNYIIDQCKNNNINSLRCDTHRDNKIMQHTLTKNGYSYCGIIYLENGDERFGYEHKLN